MTAPRTLARPPIKEAVLEVLFNYPATIDLNFLGSYNAIISSRFPTRENVINIIGSLGDASTISRVTIGHVYYSPDNKTFIQTRMNGFSFAQANQSYTDWKTFKPLAFKELQSFIDFTGPLSISRFSLRFINEIQIPSSRDFKEYVQIFPNIDILKLPVKNFISRVELINPDIDATAVVSQLVSPPFEPTVNMFLDIDVIINHLAPIGVDLEYLSRMFDKLRDFKNTIFFTSLTDMAIDSYS
jgi:uncharacterized protein (TIGR04255 family)